MISIQEKPYYLYAIPVAWMVFVFIFSFSLQKEGFVGAATVAIMVFAGIAMLIGIVTYHITKKVLWSILSIPILFFLLLLLVPLIDRIL